MNCGALFNKVCPSCSHKEHSILYISLDIQIFTLSTDMINNEIDQGMAVILCHLSEIAHYSHIFLNMDISLIISHICMKISIHVTETCLEGSKSQFVYIEHSFCFNVCKRREFEIKHKISQKLPVYCHKVKTRA